MISKVLKRDFTLFFYPELLYETIVPIVFYNDNYSFDECIKILNKDNFRNFCEKSDDEDTRTVLGSFFYHLDNDTRKYDENKEKFLDELDTVILSMLSRHFNDREYGKKVFSLERSDNLTKMILMNFLENDKEVYEFKSKLNNELQEFKSKEISDDDVVENTDELNKCFELEFFEKINYLKLRYTPHV